MLGHYVLYKFETSKCIDNQLKEFRKRKGHFFYDNITQ